MTSIQPESFVYIAFIAAAAAYFFLSQAMSALSTGTFAGMGSAIPYLIGAVVTLLAAAFSVFKYKKEYLDPLKTQQQLQEKTTQ